MNIQIRNPKFEIRKKSEARRTKAAIAPFGSAGHSPCVIRHSAFENGMATVLFIALLAIMMVFVMVESQALIRLRREVKLLEQQQSKRLNGPQTNAVPTATIP